MLSEYGENASYQYAQIYARWGQPELALDWLEHAIEIRDAGITLVGQDRAFETLADEPRFQKILEAAAYR